MIEWSASSSFKRPPPNPATCNLIGAATSGEIAPSLPKVSYMTMQHTVRPTPAEVAGDARPNAARAVDPPAPPRAGLLPALWRHRGALAVGAVAGVMLGLLASFLQPTTYRSESRIFFSSQSTFNPLGNDSFTSDPTRYLQQQVALLTSEPVLTQAIEADESIGGLVEVQDALTITASSEADIVTVKASADTATRAAARVDAVVDAYRAFQLAAITGQTEALTDLSTATERRQIEQRAALYGDGVELVEPPATEKASALIRNTTIGGLVGLLLALAWALGRSRPTPDAAAERSDGEGREPLERRAPVRGDWDWDAASRP